MSDNYTPEVEDGYMYINNFTHLAVATIVKDFYGYHDTLNT